MRRRDASGRKDQNERKGAEKNSPKQAKADPDGSAFARFSLALVFIAQGLQQRLQFVTVQGVPVRMEKQVMVHR